MRVGFHLRSAEVLPGFFLLQVIAFGATLSKAAFAKEGELSEGPFRGCCKRCERPR